MSRPSALWTLVNTWSVVTYLRVSWSELPLDNAIDLKKPFTAGTAYVITGFAAYNKSRSKVSLWDYLCEKSSSNFITNQANILKFCLSALSQSFPGHLFGEHHFKKVSRSWIKRRNYKLHLQRTSLQEVESCRCYHYWRYQPRMTAGFCSKTLFQSSCKPKHAMLCNSSCHCQWLQHNIAGFVVWTSRCIPRELSASLPASDSIYLRNI